MTNYKGDICKYLTLTKSTNGNNFKKSWKMPVASAFSDRTTTAPSYTTTAFDNYSPDGSGNQTVALLTFTSPDGDGEEIILPAAGRFDLGTVDLYYVGNRGFYWSSSEIMSGWPGTAGYRPGSAIDMFQGNWGDGFSVRCVQE